MLTSQEAAIVLLRWSPNVAPVTLRQFSNLVGGPPPETARRRGGSYFSGTVYTNLQRMQPEWPDPVVMVQASLQELLNRRRAITSRPSSDQLIIRPARDGERYKTWDSGSHADRERIAGRAGCKRVVATR